MTSVARVALAPYQLEALARLCFELQSTGELGTRVAAHAQTKRLADR